VRYFPTSFDQFASARESTWVTQYMYDKTGNRTQILYPTDDPGERQGQVDYTYDAADRVSKGKGCKYRNDRLFDLPRVDDPRTQCGPWNDECKTGQCLQQAFESYPDFSDYQLLRGPNSNSFARTLTESCGLTPPSLVGSSWQAPGWNKQGRPAKNRKFRCPPERR